MGRTRQSRKEASVVRSIVLAAALASMPAVVVAEPVSVTIVGSLQSELGCSGDWDPACAVTALAYDANDTVWQGSFGTLPASAYEYKAALDGSFTVNYGGGAVLNGANIPLVLAAGQSVKFYYDDASHWVTDSVNDRIVTAAGSFQSELGCSGDWDPGCLRSWLQDPDGDGVYTFVTDLIPAGDYEVKATLSESFGENYGAGGLLNGANIAFSVPTTSTRVLFSFASATNLLTVTVGDPGTTSVPAPGTSTLLAAALAGLGVMACRRRRDAQARRPR